VLSGSRWRPARRMFAKSVLANLFVLFFVVTIFWSLDLPDAFRRMLINHPVVVMLVLAGLIALRQARRYAHPRIGRLWGLVLRLPFRTGMFSNFERTRYLKKYIPAEGLRNSQIRVVLTSTDLQTGSLRYFTNADPAAFLSEPGVDRAFARRELVQLPNLMPAVIASSALPIAYEPYELDGKLLADGAIVGSQPIRPAIRLGADVLLLISMENPGGTRGPLHTFVDVGIRALDILMQRNLHADVALLAQANGQIEAAASALAMRPEDLVIEFEGRMFRYVKAFAIKPDRPIENSILDFGGRATGDTILRGYIDACTKIEEFARYAANGGFKRSRHTLPLELIKPRRSKSPL
jgi:predicted acylesterase/phospholipase RssA